MNILQTNTDPGSIPQLISSSPPRNWPWVIGLAVLLFTLSAAIYWDVLSDPDQVLAFNDGNIESVLSPAYHYPSAFFGTWANQFFFGAGGGAGTLNVTAIGESLGPAFYRGSGQAIILTLCGLAFYWLFRQYRFAPVPSALAAAIASLTGWCFTFPMVGLSGRPEGLAFTALSLGFMERGRQTKGWLAYAIGGGFLGLCISEIPDVGIFFALTTAVIFWWTHLLGIQNAESRIQNPEVGKKLIKESASNFPRQSRSKARGLISIVFKFTLYVAFSGIMAWQIIGSMFSTQIQGVTQGTSESPEARYAWATQWSIPPAEMWNTVSGSYFGSSMRSEVLPYWGRMGRSEDWETTRQGFRNFSMCGWHLGVVPCILLISLFIYMFMTRRQDVPLLGHKLTNNVKEDVLYYPLAHPKAFTLMIFLGAAVSIMLMWGKYFPLYRLFWSLPYMSTIRNPEKWNGPFTLFAILGIAFMLDLLWRHLNSAQGTSTPSLRSNRETLRLSLLYSSLGMATIALFIFIGTTINKTSFITHRLQEGYKDTAEISYDNAIAACLKVLIISGLFAALVAWMLREQKTGSNERSAVSSRQNKQTKGLNRTTRQNAQDSAVGSSNSAFSRPLLTNYCLLALLAIGDLYLVNRPYVMGHKYKHFLQPNPLTEFLDAHRTEGRIKLIPPQHPLLNNLHLSLLQIKGYDMFDPVSVSRMPTDYDTFFKAFDKNPIRLWELGSLRYFLTLPGVIEELNKLDGNKGRFIERFALGVGIVEGAYLPVASAPPEQRYLRLVEFTGALPKYRLAGSALPVTLDAEGDSLSLKALSDSQFDLANKVTLHSASKFENLSIPTQSSITVINETSTDILLHVKTDSPCLLIRSTKFDADWNVTVGGVATPLLRVDNLFQGVSLPAGEHEVFFAYRVSLKPLVLSAVSRIAFCIIIIIGVILGNRRVAILKCV